MLHQHPAKDSHEIEERVNEYLGALDRIKRNKGRNKHGFPIYREDGSIGVDWSMVISDEVKITG